MNLHSFNPITPLKTRVLTIFIALYVERTFPTYDALGTPHSPTLLTNNETRRKQRHLRGSRNTA